MWELVARGTKFAFLFFLILFNRLVLAVLGLCCCVGFSLVETSRSYSLIVGLRLLNAATSFAAEHRPWGTWASVIAAPGHWNTGSGVVAHGLSCFSACGIFLNQRSNPCALHYQADSLPPSHQGSPR